MGNLSKLTYLNLFGSFFCGQMPQEIPKLTKLAKLDLSFNLNYSHQGLLELKRPSLNSLTKNLTRLEWLDISSVGIDSPIHKAFTNMSSLIYLYLGQCGLLGNFPTTIFQIPKLEILDLDNNWELSGNLPNFHFQSQLRVLDFSNISFSDLAPPSIGNLTKLQVLDLHNSSFSRENVPFFSILT
ncbi:hypothetical protein SLA2020_229700 [Shorea laevis]